MFHIRTGAHARAFNRPTGRMSAVAMFLRGWRPFGINGWWHKPSRNRVRYERGA